MGINISKKKKNGGFSLIELIVASSVFIVVMLMSSSAVYTVFNSNQKSKNTRSVMDNLNLSLESMSRSIRFGKNYHCGNTGTLTTPLDCSNNTTGSSYITFLDMDGNQVIYTLFNGRIQRTIGSEVYYMTSPDVTITTLTFRVYGSASYTTGDWFQPKVIMVISGRVGEKISTRSTFTIETTISQRQFDFQ
ncbi:MAG: type II secretion system protein [Minisyncoccia bacterium]